MKHLYLHIVLLLAFAALALAQDQPEAQLAPSPLKLQDILLKDPFIVKADDGTYYLTGTTKINSLDPKFSDFQNNDGVRLWKSKDLKNWEDVGLVWDLSKTGGRDAKKSGWQAHLRAVPGEPDKAWSRGVTAPELHFVKGAWWIVFALNDQDIGLLKSSSGKPEGPYEEVGRMSNRFLGGDGSLFEDSDPSSPDGSVATGGKVYLVWGGGYIAPMKDDMSDIAEEPKSLQMAIKGYPQTMPLSNQHGERGAFVFKQGDTYHFLYSAWNLRDGKAHFDTVVCTSKSLLGPHSKPRLLVPNTRQTAAFRDTDGTRQIIYDGGDANPVVRAFDK
ncbi:MAG: family 43 glycosylhydrolase [Candidatus Sumerlaeota bacterium]